MKLYKRDIFDKIKRYLNHDTVIVLHGARQVGKTYILFHLRDFLLKNKKRVFYFDLEYPILLSELNKGVDTFIQLLKAKGYKEGQKVYVLIDEVQYLDNPSSFIKIIADHYKNIHLIVSGSSSFNIKSKFTDSLVGRTVNFEIFNLSFMEFLNFKNIKININEAKTESIIIKLQELYKEYVIFGGYPKVVLEDDYEVKKMILLQIIDTYIRKDIRDLAKVDDIKKFNNLLYVLSSQSANLLNLSALSVEAGVSFPTLQKYLSILEETYIIKLIPPYSKNPSVEISKNPKIFFYDSGLQSILWLKDFPKTILGSVLETNIFGELVKKYGKDNIYFWRTKSKREIDFIVQNKNSLTPIEAKLNFSSFNQKTMTAFCRKYKIRDFFVVGLGQKNKKYQKYPWEI